MKKRCCTCHKHKPLTSFSKARGRKDGLYAQCRTCQNEAARAFYKQHREKILERTRIYAEQPHVKQRIHERNKLSYWANRDFHLNHAKQWLRKNHDRRRTYIREWNRENRDLVRSYQKAYKARKRGATETPLTAVAWHSIKDAFRNRCVYCGKVATLEQDHVIPLSKGGKHAIHNIVPACRECNASKADRAAPPFWWTAS